MRKITTSFNLFLLLFFLSVLSLVSPSETKAQAAASQDWVCLNATRCHENGARCEDDNQFPEVVEKVDVHRVKLTVPEGVMLAPNATGYIVECISASTEENTDQVCTTAATPDNAEMSSVLGTAGIAEINAVAGRYTFEGLFGPDGRRSPSGGNPLIVEPVRTDATGSLPILYWQVLSSQNVSRRFYLVRGFMPSGFTPGNEGGQQQATFFTSTTNSSCGSVRWDPYGFVFDSQSLEPIPFSKVSANGTRTPIAGSEVRLLEKDVTSGTYKSVIIPLLVNPQYPEEDGLFNFVVPDGTYKLDVKKAGYTYPANLSGVNPNYSKIYSDLYPSGVGPSGGYDIVQQGRIQHRDIPLDPVDGVGKEYPVELINHMYYREDELSSRVIIEGWASHPFTKVKAYSVAATEPDATVAQPVTMLGQVQSDKVGYFRIEVDQRDIRSGEKFGKLILEKNMTPPPMSYLQRAVSFVSSLVVGNVEAQTTTAPDTNTSEVGFEPMPTYIEGYAYDQNGNIMTNATVSVIVSGTKKAYYETKADENGYYKISSEYLPILPFSLQYKTVNGRIVTITTGEVIAENASASAQTDYYTYRNASGTAITIAPTQAVQIDNGAGQVKIDEQIESPVSYFLIIVIVILLLLGIAGVILGIYLLRKKEV